jgi:plasmid stabilization system protein ParE
MRAFARVVVQLETDPSRFPFGEEAPDLGMQLREHHLGRKANACRIFFEVVDRTVRVVRVRHSARDSLTGDDV